MSAKQIHPIMRGKQRRITYPFLSTFLHRTPPRLLLSSRTSEFHHATPKIAGEGVDGASRHLHVSPVVGDGGGCIDVDIAAADEDDVTTSVLCAAYVDGYRVGLVGVRISCTGIEEKSHRSVFDFTNKFVLLPGAPASTLTALVVAGAVVPPADVCFPNSFVPTALATGIATDGVGLAGAMLRLVAAVAAALAADIRFAKNLVPTAAIED
jgi:hypothetical protein